MVIERQEIIKLLQQREQEKRQLLKDLDTKTLIEKITEAEDNLEKLLRDDAGFRNLNSEYLAAYDKDSSKVERLLAELSLNRKNQGDKITVDAMKAWLCLERKKDEAVIAAINRQNNVILIVENNRISIELARHRLGKLRAVLALKIAQIEFLKE